MDADEGGEEVWVDGNEGEEDVWMEADKGEEEMWREGDVGAEGTVRSEARQRRETMEDGCGRSTGGTETCVASSGVTSCASPPARRGH